MNRFSHSTPMLFDIQVKGHLGELWASRFDGFSTTTGFTSDGIPVTSFSGVVADQAALHGILAAIRDTGLQLLSVKRIAKEHEDEGNLGPHKI